MRKKWLLAAVSAMLVFVMLMSVTGCITEGGKPAEVTEQAEVENIEDVAEVENTVTALSTEPYDWNPHTWTTAADGMMFDYMVTPMVGNYIGADGETMEFVFLAASEITDITADFADKEAWGIDADAEEMYVFQIDLNPLMTWADGTPINADSYIYSMQALLDPAMPNLRASGYINGDQGQNAIRGTFGYNNNDKVGEVIYRDVFGADLDEDTPILLDPTAPCFFFGGNSMQDYYEAGFVPYFINDDGVDLFELYAESGDYFEITDDIREDVIEGLLTIACFFGDYNPEAWIEFCHYVDGIYEETPWENVGLQKTGEYQLLYIMENPVALEDFMYSLRRNWLVNEELYEANKVEFGGYLYTDYNTDADTSASYGAYKLESFASGDGMVFVKNDNWFGWNDENVTPISEFDTVAFSFPYVAPAVVEEPAVEETAVAATEATEPGAVHPFPYEFEGVNVFGETITNEDLGEKEIFFVHLWATWCGPCVGEMAELVQIANTYSDRVGFIALITDYDDGLKAAVRLAEYHQTPFSSVSHLTEGLEDLYQMLRSGYVPTTILIDGDGNMIGDQIIGSYGLEYANFIEDALKAVK